MHSYMALALVPMGKKSEPQIALTDSFDVRFLASITNVLMATSCVVSMIHPRSPHAWYDLLSRDAHWLELRKHALLMRTPSSTLPDRTDQIIFFIIPVFVLFPLCIHPSYGQEIEPVVYSCGGAFEVVPGIDELAVIIRICLYERFIEDESDHCLACNQHPPHQTRTQPHQTRSQPHQTRTRPTHSHDPPAGQDGIQEECEPSLNV